MPIKGNLNGRKATYMGQYSSKNSAARNTSILLIAERFGINASMSQSGNFYFEKEKNPSLHININENIFFYHGQNSAFTDSIGKNGGDAIDFTAFCIIRYGAGDKRLEAMAKTYAEGRKNKNSISPRDFAEAMDALTSFITGVQPSISHLMTGAQHATRGAAGSVLAEYRNFSGGAFESDLAWDQSVTPHGAKTMHFYCEESNRPKPPYANTVMPAEDIEEGRTQAASAAKRMYGYSYGKMNDSLVVRDWEQVKNADAVFAVGQLVKAGSKFNPTKENDDRITTTDTVIGGTGYAVNMAILNDKPVYVFNQIASEQFPIGWYTYSKEAQSYTPCDVPTLTKNFAGVGSRKLTDEGRKAIKDCVYKTVQSLVQSKSQEELDYSDIQVITSEPDSANIRLHNSAFRPFRYKGQLFISVEQFIQWNKALALGNNEIADRILKINDREFEYTIDNEKKTASLAAFEWAEEIPSAAYDKAVAASQWCSKLVSAIQYTAEQKTYWESIQKSVAATGLHLSFISNADTAKALLETGNAVLKYSDDAIGEDMSDILLKERTYLHENGFEHYRSNSPYIVESYGPVTDAKFINYLKYQRGFSNEMISKGLYQVVVYKEDNPEKKTQAIGTPTVETPATWNIRFVPLRYKDENTGQWVSVERNSPKVSTGQNVTLIDREYNFIKEGQNYNRAHLLKIYEGQMNPLADMMLSGRNNPGCMDVMTLNSTENYKRAYRYADAYPTVILCLDNDRSGHETTLLMAKHFLERGIKVFDSRPCFINKEGMLNLVAVDQETKQIIPSEEMKRRHENGENNRPWTMMVSSKQGLSTVESVWEGKVGVGPNDVNDRLVAEKKLTPDVKIPSRQAQQKPNITQKPA